MQAVELINKDSLFELVKTAFDNGELQMFETYSQPEEEWLEFKNPEQFQNHLTNFIEQRKNFQFSLYYSEGIGKVVKERISLNPKYCNGKTWRYRISGWGDIQLQLAVKNSNDIFECRIAVNTEKRAKAWEDITSELGKAEAWNWKAVESKTRSLIRILRKLKEA